jgi:hypothetical protein
MQKFDPAYQVWAFMEFRMQDYRKVVTHANLYQTQYVGPNVTLRRFE